MKIKSKFNSYLKNEIFFEKTNEIQAQFEELENKIHHNKCRIEETENKIPDIMNQLSKKIEKYHLASESTKIWNKIRTLAVKKDVEELNKKVLPYLNTVRLDMTRFEKELTQSKKIIQRFDEVLLDKAPKHKYEELGAKFESFLTKDEYLCYEQAFKNELQQAKLKIEENHQEIQNSSK